MKFKRRDFLKYIGLGSFINPNPLEGQTSDSEEKTVDLVGKFQYDLAIHNLDFAEKYLTGLINNEYTGPHRTYASNLDSAARFIHFGAWRELPSIEKVKKNYLPLLQQARDSIDLNDPAEIKKHNPAVIKNNADYPKSAMHVKACISFRIKNLERYCKGLNSDTESCVKEVEKEGNYQFIRD